jgi:hypothetical protein
VSDQNTGQADLAAASRPDNAAKSPVFSAFFHRYKRTLLAFDLRMIACTPELSMGRQRRITGELIGATPLEPINSTQYSLAVWRLLLMGDSGRSQRRGFLIANGKWPMGNHDWPLPICHYPLPVNPPLILREWP